MNRLLLVGAIAGISASANAAFVSQTVRFNELDLGTKLDDLTVGSVSFEFEPASESSVVPEYADTPFNGGNFGATDNLTARGSPDGESVLRVALEGCTIDHLGFGISTLPFSPAPFTVSVGLVNDQGAVFESLSYDTDTLVRLGNNLPLLRYGIHDVDLSGSQQSIYALELTFSGNTSNWFLDNLWLEGQTVPTPMTSSLLGVGILTATRRRRTH